MRHPHRLCKQSTSFARRLLPILGLSGLALIGSVQAAPADQKVNPRLAGFQQRFDAAQLIRVGESVGGEEGRVMAAFAYDYSNFGFILGDDGIIVVDTGWFPHTAKRALADLREITDKPIKAMIITHPHPDHVGGMKLFQDEAGGDIPIYCPDGWQERFEYDASIFTPMIVRRGLSQMGVMLPPGEMGTVGTGVGPTPRFDTYPERVPVTHTVYERQEITIDGVRIELIPSGGDIKSNMIVWLPEDRVMFPGDTIDGAFPSLATPRYEPERTGAQFLPTVEWALTLKPTAVVGGHGRILTDEDEIRYAAETRADLIRFMRDQIDRLVNKGYSADRIIETLELPEELANHPELQPHYHRVPWMIRQMVMKRAGFASGPWSLMRHSEGEEARRWLDLLGGTGAALEHAEAALAQDDPRWATTLASYVLMSEPENERAQAVLLNSYARIAALTDSTSERNYALTAIGEAQGKVPWKQVVAKVYRDNTTKAPTALLLEQLRTRFRAEAAEELRLRVRVDISDESASHCLVVRRQTLRYEAGAQACGDAHLSLARDAVVALHSGENSLQELMDGGRVAIHSGRDAAETLASLIEKPVAF